MSQIRRVRTVFSGVAGVPWINNLYFTFVAGQADAIAGAVGTFWQTVDAFMDNAITWSTEAEQPLIEDTTGLITGLETAAVFTGAGGEASDPLPYMTQGLVNEHTGVFLLGRELRGKIFVPGMCENANTSAGLMDPTINGQIQAAAAALITNTSSPGPWRVFSRRNLTSRVVTSTETPTKWAVLRSRRD